MCSLDNQDDADLIGYRGALRTLERQRSVVSHSFLLCLLHLLCVYICLLNAASEDLPRIVPGFYQHA